MLKLLTVVGARPQLIKAAIVSKAINKLNQQQGEKIEEVLVHTGQHYDKNMSDIFFQQLNIAQPKYNLAIGSGSHATMTANMLIGLEKTLKEVKPDLMLIYGDTNSTLAGVLSAVKLNIKVAHVEAGLRSFNRQMPEEINRIVADQLSNYLFCPTMTAMNNLQKEGVVSDHSHIVKYVGDVMYDMALYAGKQLQMTDEIKRLVDTFDDGFALMTIHRPRNVDDPQVLDQILKTVVKNTDLPVVFPVHPRTRKNLLSEKNYTGINFISPVSYLDMQSLLKSCQFVLTDSGGLQKEAYFFSKPCLVFREETEWVELVENNFSHLVGSNPLKIEAAMQNIQQSSLDFSKRLYGEGNAAELIVTEILK